MKKLLASTSLLLCLCFLSACAGTPVIYHTDCNCPTATAATAKPSTPAPAPVEGALQTGLSIVATMKESASATADAAGKGKYDVTVVAVLVDDAGVIRDCKIDGIAAEIAFDANGAITSDLTKPPQTKNELGASYGMVAWGGAIAEWDSQADALAQFAIGKTVEELKNGAIDETGKAPVGSDLASSATIYLGGYVSAIEDAVSKASYLGAEGGDSLRLASVIAIDGSRSATADKAGETVLEATVTALTLRDGVISSCALDSVQAKVSFDTKGVITSDTAAVAPTKNELGASYGMVAWGGAIAEWDAQAASFASYITGKTPASVADIAVSETTKPTEADLASSVTIAIGGFQALIAKACK